MRETQYKEGHPTASCCGGKRIVQVPHNPSRVPQGGVRIQPSMPQPTPTGAPIDGGVVQPQPVPGSLPVGPGGTGG